MVASWSILKCVIMPGLRCTNNSTCSSCTFSSFGFTVNIRTWDQASSSAIKYLHPTYLCPYILVTFEKLLEFDSKFVSCQKHFVYIILLSKNKAHFLIFRNSLMTPNFWWFRCDKLSTMSRITNQCSICCDYHTFNQIHSYSTYNVLHSSHKLLPAS